MDALLRRRLMILSGGPIPPPTPQPVFYDRLVFDGTAYIATDIVLPSMCSLKVTLGNETLKATQRVFHAWSGSGTGSTYLNYGGATSSSAGRQLLAAYDSTSYISPINFYVGFDYPEFTYFATPYRYGFGDQSRTYTKGNSHPTGPLYLGHTSALTGQPYTGTMGTFGFYGQDASGCTTSSAFNSYTPIITLRPCTYIGEAGIWYVEENKFYGNTAGSGALSVLNI